MNIIKHIPFFAYLWIGYNIFVLVGAVSLDAEWLRVSLISGALLTMDVHDLFVGLGTVALYLEIFRATKASLQSIINHSLSMVVFVFFLIEFIVFEGVGTSSFLLLTLMSFLDVIAGFTVTISTARRDVALGG